jgi:hypothetical protein
MGKKRKGEWVRRETENREEEKGRIEKMGKREWGRRKLRIDKKGKGEWGRRKGIKGLVERTGGVRYTYSSFSDFF